MANGNSVTTNKLKMSVNWGSLEVKTFNQDITLNIEHWTLNIEHWTLKMVREDII